MTTTTGGPRHAVGALVLLAASALVLSGCASTDGDQESVDASSLDESTTLVIGDIASDLEATLGAAGQLDDIPYDAQFTPITDFTAIYSSLASGQLDVGIWGLDANGLLAVQNGAAVKLVTLFGAQEDDQANREAGLFAVVVRSDSGIESPADLAGTTVATGGSGITPDVVLTAALASAGLTQDDVDVARFSDSTSQLTAFLQGDADVYAGSLSNAQILEAINSGEATPIYYSDQATNVRFLVATNQEVLDDPEKSAALADFIERISYYYQWRSAPESLDAFAVAVAEVTLSDTDVARQIAELQATSALPLAFTDETEQTLQSDLDSYLEWGYLTEPITVDELIDTRFNEEIESAISEAP